MEFASFSFKWRLFNRSVNNHCFLSIPLTFRNGYQGVILWRGLSLTAGGCSLLELLEEFGEHGGEVSHPQQTCWLFPKRQWEEVLPPFLLSGSVDKARRTGYIYTEWRKQIFLYPHPVMQISSLSLKNRPDVQLISVVEYSHHRQFQVTDGLATSSQNLSM